MRLVLLSEIIGERNVDVIFSLTAQPGISFSGIPDTYIYICIIGELATHVPCHVS